MATLTIPLKTGDRVIITYYDLRQNLSVARVDGMYLAQAGELNYVKLKGVTGEFFSLASMNLLAKLVKNKETFTIVSL